MRILISGSHGLIGSHLKLQLENAGHETGVLVRREAHDPDHEVSWDPVGGMIDTTTLSSYDAVVHLAGKSIADLWTATHKREVWRSRIEGTKLLAATLALLGKKGPRILISTSSIGYYGNRGDEHLDEGSSPGEGFLADLCQEWEAATQPATDAGVRVVLPRFGIVLSRDGGFLTPLTPLFRLGLGARIGSGRQWMSWVHLDDVTRILLDMLEEKAQVGVVNVVAPEAVRNGEFTRRFAGRLKRPALFVLPEFLLKLLPGGMGQEMFLASQHVLPSRLLERGFSFNCPDLESALTACFPNS